MPASSAPMIWLMKLRLVSVGASSLCASAMLPRCSAKAADSSRFFIIGAATAASRAASLSISDCVCSIVGI